MSPQDSEREAARVTIVGGQPPGNARALDQGVPVALEQLLKMAAVDEAFREALLADWSQAVEAAGLTVVPTEARILEVVEAEQLRRMIDEVGRRLAGEERRTFLAAAAAAVLGLAGGSAMLASGCRTAPQPQPQRGVRADRPPMTRPVAPPAGIRPRRTPVPAGIQPQPPPPRRSLPYAGAVPTPQSGQLPRRPSPDAGPPDAARKRPLRRQPPPAGIPPDRVRPRKPNVKAGMRSRDDD